MKKLKILLIALAALRMLIAFLLQHPSYQPHRDEFLYLDYANHLDWGYMEVPPMLSLFAWLIKLTGSSLFWIKFWPALFGSLTFLLCGHLILRFKGGAASLWILFGCFMLGAHLRMFHLFQPGFLEVFSWTLISYCLIRFIDSVSMHWAIAFGMACGFGLNSKYTTCFFLAALVIGLVLSGRYKMLWQKEMLAAAGVALLLWFPNLWWQYSHRFPVVSHMQELRETQLQYVNPVSFVLEQILMMLPVAAVWITGIVVLFRHHNYRKYRWLAWQYFATIALLLLGSGKPYYALGLYPILFAFGAIVVGKWLMTKKPLVRLAIVALPIFLGLFAMPLAMPLFKAEKLAKYYATTGINKAPFFKWEDLQMHPLPQDFADMIGWREIAEMTAKQWHALPDSVQQHTLLYCRGYFTAGALNLYGKKLRLPTAHSDNGSYLLWLPDTLQFKHLMMIGHQNPGPDDEVFNHFASRQILDSLQYPLFRENGIRVYFFKDADDEAARLATEGIRKEKSNFNR